MALSESTIDTWRNTYGNYVPLMRDMESDDNYSGAFGLGMRTGAGFSVKRRDPVTLVIVAE